MYTTFVIKNIFQYQNHMGQYYCCCYCFLGPHPWHMEVPRLGVELELQLLAYTTATATPDLSRVCNLHHSSRPCQILNPLSEARDWTHVLMDTSQIHFHWATTGTLRNTFQILPFPLSCCRSSFPPYHAPSGEIITIGIFLGGQGGILGCVGLAHSQH